MGVWRLQGSQRSRARCLKVASHRTTNHIVNLVDDFRYRHFSCPVGGLQSTERVDLLSSNVGHRVTIPGDLVCKVRPDRGSSMCARQGFGGLRSVESRNGYTKHSIAEAQVTGKLSLRRLSPTRCSVGLSGHRVLIGHQ